jgi:16S rRNA (guanine527-N7)-methyltransferase
MELILRYFPELTAEQIAQFEQLEPLYREWNEKINVISRKDLDNLYERHVLHSLAIVRFMKFRSGAEILDLGTGGGFPGIPLAIYYPGVQFTLIDGTGKKIKVVQAVAEALGLKNVKAMQKRAEELKKVRFDFVVSRAVASIDKLMMWSKRLLKRNHRHPFPNGLLCLKGGKIGEEIRALPPGDYTDKEAISEYFEEDFFKEKWVVYGQG